MKDTIFTIDFANKEDYEIIYSFICKLAEYEKMTDDIKMTPEMLKENIFEKKECEVLIARENDIPIGFALFFYNFSTFLGKRGLYLEDLFILPEHRHKGYGKKIFKTLAKIAKEKDCGRMEWSCLNWNEPSIRFYNSMGAVPMDEWTVRRLDENGIKALCEK